MFPADLVNRPGMSFGSVIVWPQASQTCCDIPTRFGTDIPLLSFLFCLRGGDGGRDLKENRSFGARRQSRMCSRPRMCTMFPSLQSRLDSSGASVLETSLSALVIGGCIFCHASVLLAVPPPLSPRCSMGWAAASSR